MSIMLFNPTLPIFRRGERADKEADELCQPPCEVVLSALAVGGTREPVRAYQIKYENSCSVLLTSKKGAGADWRKFVIRSQKRSKYHDTIETASMGRTDYHIRSQIAAFRGISLSPKHNTSIIRSKRCINRKKGYLIKRRIT